MEPETTTAIELITDAAALKKEVDAIASGMRYGEIYMVSDGTGSVYYDYGEESVQRYMRVTYRSAWLSVRESSYSPKFYANWDLSVIMKVIE